MEIHVDLFGCRNKLDVLLRFGEILQFGGPKGNVPAKSDIMDKGWGLNWDAFNDCLRDLETGGIWGTSEKVRFPFTLIIHNYGEFAKNQDFKILKDILKDQQEDYNNQGKEFEVIFD